MGPAGTDKDDEDDKDDGDDEDGVCKAAAKGIIILVPTLPAHRTGARSGEGDVREDTAKVIAILVQASTYRHHTNIAAYATVPIVQALKGGWRRFGRTSSGMQHRHSHGC